MPREVADAEEHVSELLGDGSLVAGRDGVCQLVELLSELLARSVDVWPVEADLGGLLADPVGAEQGGQRARDAGEGAAVDPELGLRRVAIRLLVETLAKLPDTLDDPALVKALLCAVGSSDAEVRHQGVTEACTVAADARLPIVTGDTPTTESVVKALKDTLEQTAATKDAGGFYKSHARSEL